MPLSHGAPVARKQSIAVGPAQSVGRAALQYDVAIAMGIEPNLAYAVDVDDRGTVNPDEARGIELPFDFRQRQAQKVFPLAVDQHHVVAGRLDGVHVRHLNQHDPVALTNREAALISAHGRIAFAPPLELLEEPAQLGALGKGDAALELHARPAKRLLEARFREWLQQIIESVDLERLENMGFVGGDEDDHGQMHARHALENLDAVESGHLDVEVHEVGPV